MRCRGRRPAHRAHPRRRAFADSRAGSCRSGRATSRPVGSSSRHRDATCRRAIPRRAGSTGSRPCRSARTSVTRRPRCRAPRLNTAVVRTRTARGRVARRSTAPRRSRTARTSNCRGVEPCPRARGRSARRASRRCRSRDPGGGFGRGRCSPSRAGADSTRTLG